MRDFRDNTTVSFIANIIQIGTFIVSFVPLFPQLGFGLPVLNLGNSLSTLRILVAGIIIFAANFGSISLFVKANDASLFLKSLSVLFAAWLILFGIRDVLFDDKIERGFLFSIVYFLCVWLFYTVYEDKRSSMEKSFSIISHFIFLIFWLLSVSTLTPNYWLIGIVAFCSLGLIAEKSNS